MARSGAFAAPWRTTSRTQVECPRTPASPGESSRRMIEGKEFARRRRQLMRMAGRDAIVIVPAAPERVRNNDAHYPYRQDSDFHYLTGFPEAEAVLALIPGREPGETILFCPEPDAECQRLDSPRAGTDGRVGASG